MKIIINKKIIIIIFLFCFSLKKSQFISLKFIKKNSNKNSIESILENNYLTTLKVGSKKEEISLEIRFDFEIIIIKNLTKKSKTFKNLTKSKKISLNNENYFGIFSNESFFINENEFENINFILSENFPKNIFGLKIDFFSPNLIIILKSQKKINFYSFFFVFDDLNLGKIFIGDFPHKIFPKKFKENNLKITKLNENFNLNFDVFVNDKKFILQNVYFNINFEGIVASIEYKFLIYKIFFKNLIEKKICFEDFYFDFNNKINYSFFYCENNNEIFNNFPKLNFYQKIFNFTFDFDFNDLFILKENKFYFVIFFKEINFSWIVGSIFLKKFLLFFDQEKKIIGFYDKNYNNNNFNNKKNLIFFLIFLIFLLLLFYIYFFFVKKQRKIHANELNDVYDYEPKNKFIEFKQKIIN